MQTTLVKPRAQKYIRGFKPFSTRFPADEYDRMYATAAKCGMSGAAFFRQCVEQYCNAVDAYLAGETENHEVEILIGPTRH